ncbi:MAG: sialate O-acetylesterase [Chitinispirillaceae bacterium]|nr:sialate O-acetylesterase [Chitinispirillaceae bacterium]
MLNNIFISNLRGDFVKFLLSMLFYFTLLFAKTPVPLFLFSGQSNMVGLGASTTTLTAEQKKPVENVKIDCVADQNVKKWTTLGPGFGNDGSHFGPELFFGRTLVDSMPNTKIAFIKDAVSGTYLGKADGWLPPSSNNGTGGTLYNKMMTHIDNALKTFNNAFDTSQYTPMWAGFIWLQGEFDGWNDKTLADKYETNLTNLINDIRKKTGVTDLPVIIPMISPESQWQYSSIIRTAEVNVTKKLKNCDTMDTKGLKLADRIHYDTESMIKIGTICAQRWINMHFNYGQIVPVVYQPDFTSISQRVLTSFSSSERFDLSGRKVVFSNAAPFLSITKRADGKSDSKYFIKNLTGLR